jgi:hypothetical protein
MVKIVVDQFELTAEYTERLFAELKDKGVKSEQDLQKYLKSYSYMNDTSRKCHLLISPNDKKESFALPYE